MLTIGAKDALRKEDLPFTFGTWVLWAPVVLTEEVGVLPVPAW